MTPDKFVIKDIGTALIEALVAETERRVKAERDLAVLRETYERDAREAENNRRAGNEWKLRCTALEESNARLRERTAEVIRARDEAEPRLRALWERAQLVYEVLRARKNVHRVDKAMRELGSALMATRGDFEIPF